MRDPEAVFAEARALRLQTARATGAAFSEVELETDARPVVAALWRGLGWSALYEKLGLVHPTLAAGRAHATRVVSSWNRSRMSTLTRAALPAKLRVVFDDGAGVGFQIADETSPGREPRLLGVVCDTSRVVRERGSYVQAVVQHVVEHLGQLSRNVWIDITPVSLLSGRQPYPVIAPQVVEIASGLVVQRSAGARGASLMFARHEDLFAWFESAPLRRIEVGAFPKSVLVPIERSRDLLARLKDVRDLPTGGAKTRLLLGTLEGQRVLVQMGGKAMISVLAGDRDAAYAALHETPIRPGWAAPDMFHEAPLYLDATESRPTQGVFDRAVENLGGIARRFGTGPRAEPPSDLATRPRQVLEALAGTCAALTLPSVTETDALLEALLLEWRSLRDLKDDGWYRKDPKRSRAALPARTRLVHGPEKRDSPVVLITDEDEPSNDPIVLAVSPQWQRIHIASPTLSPVLFAMALKRFRGGQLRRAPMTPDAISSASKPLDPLSPNFLALREGVYGMSGSLWFASTDDYLAVFEAGANGRRNNPPPPDSAVRLWPAKKPKLLPEALRASDGFRSYPIKSRFKGPPITCAFGRVDGAPVWITTQQYPTSPKVEIMFMPEDRSRLESWLLKKAGKLLPPRR